jgi:predicted PolB exonuclease-like 3'-5' exonuclease
MRRLVFDIEVSPNIGWFWKPEHYMRVYHENIILEGAIICICWKWAGNRTVHSLTWDKKHNEKKMLEAFVAEMNKADELVTHNGDKFDIVWLRTRCLVNGVPMMPDYVSIDTYKAAKAGFNFMSNKLSHIAKVCGLGEKLDTGGAKLWKQVLMGETELENRDFWKRLILGNNQEALDKMVRYCKRDVQLLEKVWDKMNPYLKAKSHFGSATDTCPECGSGSLVVNKHRITAAGSIRISLQCKKCGKYHSVPQSKFDNPKQF